MNIKVPSRNAPVTLLCLSLLLACPLSRSIGAAGPLSLGASGGSTGAGIEAEIGLDDRMCLRFSHSLLSASRNMSWHGLPYMFDASMNWTTVLLDIHPSGGGFRFSAGAAINSGGVDLEIASTSPIELGGRVYTPEEVGTIRGEVEMNPLAPYVGLGFENRPESGRGLVLSTDIGIVAQSYRVELAHEGGTLPLNLEQAVYEAVEIEEGSLERTLNSLGIYPVIKLSLTLRI